jgi:tetratricopeptide (TPR) repeat protein
VFRKIRTKRTTSPVRLPSNWSDISSQIVDYGAWHPSFAEALERPRSLVITGPPGLGKSTYLLWAIYSTLNGTTNGWFKRVIFLDRFHCERWPTATQLHHQGHHPDDTLIVLDSPFDLDDGDTRNAAKLTELRSSYENFSVIVTMRDDEYSAHASTLATFEKAQLAWDTVQFWQILQKRLLAWGGPRLSDDDLKSLETQLREISDGAPLYLELLLNQLSEENKLKHMSSRSLARAFHEDLPRGIVNLIWQIVTKVCGTPVNADDPVLFVLKLLHKKNVSLSNHFLVDSVRLLCGSDNDARKKAMIQLARLRHYFDPAERRLPNDLEDTVFARLKNHWRTPLGRFTLANPSLSTSPYQEVIRRYIAIDYESLCHSVCEQLQTRIGNNVRSIPQVAICSDIIRLGNPRGIDITEAYVRSRESLARITVLDQLDNLLFDAWLHNAFAAQESADSCRSFDAAFGLSAHFTVDLRIRHEKKPLNYYFTWRRIQILPLLESEQFSQEVGRIIELGERLTALDRTDARSVRSLALFYMYLGDYTLAERYLESAFTITKEYELERLLILIDWGSCLRRWAKDRRVEKYFSDDRYLEKALEKLTIVYDAIVSLRNNSAQSNLSPGMVAELEHRFLLVYAGVLADASLADEAEMALRIALKIDPGDFYARNRLAQLLMSEGRLDESYSLLESADDPDQGVSDSFSLQLLGSIHTIQGPTQYRRAEAAFIKARELAENRGGGYGSLRARTTANHELAKLYLKWARQNTIEHPPDLTTKTRQAIDSCLNLPHNTIWSHQLESVHTTCSTFERLYGAVLYPSTGRIPITRDGWLRHAQDAYYSSDWPQVIIAFRAWLGLMESLPTVDWQYAANPVAVCDILRLAGAAFGAKGEACDLLYAGRYYASLCYAQLGKFPLSVHAYPVVASMNFYRRERELIAAYSGDDNARLDSLRRLELYARSRRGHGKESNSVLVAIIAHLRSTNTVAKTHLLVLGAGALAGAWEADAVSLRLLADALLSLNERVIASELWQLIAGRVTFPESLFATTMVAAITRVSD